jgi:hypothetical protein
MVMSQQRLEVPVATGISQTLSRDLRHVALIFRTPKGNVPIAIATPNIGNLVAYLVRAAQHIAARQPASFPETPEKAPPVIDLSGIETAPGRSEGETLLTVKAGPISLGMAVASASLMAAVEKPAAARKNAEKPPAAKKAAAKGGMPTGR